jgi:hypothetical protein
MPRSLRLLTAVLYLVQGQVVGSACDSWHGAPQKRVDTADSIQIVH